MAWHRSDDRSKYPDDAATLLAQSRALFDTVSAYDPYIAFEKFGPSYRLIVRGVIEDCGIEVDKDLLPYVEYGLRDIYRIVQTAFVRSRLNDVDVSHRIMIAQNPNSIETIAAMARRPEELMEVCIGDQAGAHTTLTVNSDKMNISARLTDTTSGDRCPFAGGEESPCPSPSFVRFCEWATVIAVLQDNPSYLQRTGENEKTPA